MAKTKKNRHGLAEKIANKKMKKQSEKLNPFDIKVTKEKTKIIGRKTKNEYGKPGISRNKALQKRKDTLLQEYRKKDKSNMFHDKRIGEKDTNMSAEDKMMARFTAERLKGAGKTSIFNLGDDSGLTHGGSNIADLDQFEDPRSDDENDDDPANKKLDAKFVEEAHFGGFMTMKDDEFASGKSNSRKEWVEQLIIDSKKKKAEKKLVLEETNEMTKTLDESWKTLFPSIRQGVAGFYSKKPEKDEDEGGKKDEYDMLVRELGFEKKQARGSERLKTDEEIIKEDREKLEELEADRLRRMNGEDRSYVHKSIEDMEDDKYIEKDLDPATLAYKDGVLVEGKEVFEKVVENDEEESAEDEESDESDAEDEEEEESDNYSDLEESDDETDQKAKTKKKSKAKPDLVPESDRKEIIAKATAEIPFVFNVPQSYEELFNHLSERTVEERTLIFQRIMKCNHPQLKEGNKELLQTFFTQLLQLIQDCASRYDPCDSSTSPTSLEKTGLSTITAVIPFIFQLTAMFQHHAAKSLLDVITEKFDQFNSLGRKVYPGLDTLLFLKLTCLLFPSSDYRHPVITPALQLMCSIMALARPADRSSLAASLALAAITVEYLTASKRLCPELVNLLVGLLFQACPEATTRPPPPHKDKKLLVVELPCTSPPAPLALREVASVGDVDDKFRVNCVNAAAKLVFKLMKLYRDLPSALELFQPLLPIIQNIKTENYPSEVGNLLTDIKTGIENLPAKSGAVKRAAKDTKMLRMLEPKIEEHFNPFEKRRDGNKAQLEEQKLRHKLKRERKGAKKEIRADAAFLANTKAKEARNKDLERRERTKNIMSNLGQQEGDFRKMLKKKKKF